jgi:DNA polymerase III alpha subunit (gram-positive type)
MNLLFVDFETTGLDPEIHEIIDIGCILCDAETMEVIAELDCPVKPEHIETATPIALAVNGYKAADWKEACSLAAGYEAFQKLSIGAVFTAQNVCFDYGFHLAALKKLGLKENMNYHRLDVGSMAFPLIQPYVLSLDKLRLVLSMQPEPAPHRGIHGARAEYELVLKLRRMAEAGTKLIDSSCMLSTAV